MGEPGTREGAGVVVGLPESLDRRMRLGPFPTARDALKFAAYAAVGGSVAAVAGVAWAIPFLGAGFLLSVHRGDGRGYDERFGDFLTFRWRSHPSARPLGAARAAAGPSGPFLTAVPGHLVAIVAARGIPIAFLPPSDARTLFEAYRELLRNLERGIVVQMGVEPLGERPFLPVGRPPDSGRPEDAARRGYGEMVRLLCRRRYRRRVLIALWEPSAPDASVRLEASVRQVGEGLARLGLACERLRDGALRSAAAQIGWSVGEAG